MRRHAGQVFKTVGDAFCIAFESAEEAAGAALAMQDGLARARDPLKVRMSLHTAAIHPSGEDYFGAPVNRVARILSAANGGQILMSEATRALLPVEMTAKDLGLHALKDLLTPERLWQLGPGEFEPVHSLSEVRNNLPLQTTSFLGREHELEQIEALLQKSRLVTLTGTGGTGKSRLSLQYAADHMEEYSDGVWFCEFAALPDRDEVLKAIVMGVGVPDGPGELRERLANYLAGKRSLVVLDNCEHVLDSASAIAEDLLRSCSSLVLIATSREPLGAKGEITYRVPSLPVPEMGRGVTLEDLERFGSTALFLDRLATVAPSLELREPEAVTISKICQRLDGIPLAIELAAARGRAMTLELLERRLDDRFRLLTGGHRNAISRQQTLRALIDWSVQLLNEQERGLFISLSVFAGGWDLESAEQICAFEGSGIESWDVLDLLTSLVDKSLVIYEAGVGRYRMLESIRQYSLERLDQSDYAMELRDRHMEQTLAPYLGEVVAVHGQQLDLKKFALNFENFRQAVEWSAGQPDGLPRALNALQRSWGGFFSGSRPQEYVRLLDDVLARGAGQFDEEMVAQAMINRVVARVAAGAPDLQEAIAEVQGYLGTFDEARMMQWDTVFSYATFASGGIEETLAFTDERFSRPGYREACNGYLFVHRGNALACLERYEEALPEYLEGQRRNELARDHRGMAGNLVNIISLKLITGDMNGAVGDALQLNTMTTPTLIAVGSRYVICMVFGLLALQAKDSLGTVFMSRALDRVESGSIAADPWDRKAISWFDEKMRAGFSEAEVAAGLARARRVDWEAWFKALLPVTVDQVLAGGGCVPARELLEG